MQGGKHKQPLGYSVIETMIFMAVSGVMFIFAAAFISGKTATVEYRQSVNDVNVQIRSLVNEVSNGEYESLGSKRCFANDNAGGPTFAGNGDGQGTNGGREKGNKTGCIFLGKIVHFGVDRDPRQYAVYTVVGRQTKFNSSDSVQNFADAQPVIADGGGVELTLTKKLQNGLEFTSAWVCDKDCTAAGTTQIGTFGVFGSFGGYIGNSTNNESGAQRIFTTIIPSTYFPVTDPGNDQASMISTINGKLPGLDLPATNYVANGRLILLCFVYNDKKGSVTIGGANGQSFTTDAQLGHTVSSKC